VIQFHDYLLLHIASLPVPYSHVLIAACDSVAAITKGREHHKDQYPSAARPSLTKDPVLSVPPLLRMIGFVEIDDEIVVLLFLSELNEVARI